MIDPWTRTWRAAAYAIAWILLLVSATLGGLWAQPAQQPPQPSPTEQAPAEEHP